MYARNSLFGRPMILVTVRTISQKKKEAPRLENRSAPFVNASGSATQAHPQSTTINDPV